MNSANTRKRPISQRLSKSFNSLKESAKKRLSMNIKEGLSALQSIHSKAKKDSQDMELNPQASGKCLVLAGKKIKNVSELVKFAENYFKKCHSNLQSMISEYNTEFMNTKNEFEATLQIIGLTKIDLRNVFSKADEMARKAGSNVEDFGQASKRLKDIVKINQTDENKVKTANNSFKNYLKHPNEIMGLNKNTTGYLNDNCKAALVLLLERSDLYFNLISNGLIYIQYKQAIEKLKFDATEEISKSEYQFDEKDNKDIKKAIENAQKNLDKTIDTGIKKPPKIKHVRAPKVNKSSKSLEICGESIKDWQELENLAGKILSEVLNSAFTPYTNVTSYLDNLHTSIKKFLENKYSGEKDSSKKIKKFEKKWQKKVTDYLPNYLKDLQSFKGSFEGAKKNAESKSEENKKKFEKIINSPTSLTKILKKPLKQIDKNKDFVSYTIKLLDKLPKLYSNFKDKATKLKDITREIYEDEIND